MKLSGLARLALVAFAACAALPARAAELVMMEQPGCVWCARFNAEIAPAYPKTDEGAAHRCAGSTLPSLGRTT